ncbi:DUF4197 domain-containing protein [Olivibacter ginsenosidimutans]|uniref:DUF4197 domain-containing protein n=1 Tax=Olivibacter ginsenosidimutans TaxID=1176537 RepID=A0ABP9BZ99_9SPHI
MKKIALLSTLLVSLSMLFIPSANAQWGNILKALKGDTTKAKSADTTTQTQRNNSNQTAPASSEISLGIKEALSNGLQQSIQSLAKTDGFLGNQAVKILLPPQVQKAESALKAIGLSSVSDQLVTRMNRAAESAVKEAGPVFVNALKELTVKDASNILLSGKEDAATNYFKTQTSEELTSKFKPIVIQNLEKLDVAKYWTDVASGYNKIPLVKDKMETDLNSYVTQKAIDGLFHQVAEQELKIRNNLGGSRTTSLLQKVFGYADEKKE